MEKRPSQKKIGQITIDDFVAHPVWTWADEDDESTVMPLENSEILPEDHDALFVACKLRLADGTSIPGALSVRMSDCSVYMLSFPKSNGTLFDFPLQPELKELVSREQLASHLQKPLEFVFPIEYATSQAFRGGKVIAGKVE